MSLNEKTETKEEVGDPKVSDPEVNGHQAHMRLKTENNPYSQLSRELSHSYEAYLDVLGERSGRLLKNYLQADMRMKAVLIGVHGGLIASAGLGAYLLRSSPTAVALCVGTYILIVFVSSVYAFYSLKGFNVSKGAELPRNHPVHQKARKQDEQLSMAVALLEKDLRHRYDPVRLTGKKLREYPVASLAVSAVTGYVVNRSFSKD